MDRDWILQESKKFIIHITIRITNEKLLASKWKNYENYIIEFEHNLMLKIISNE